MNTTVTHAHTSLSTVYTVIDRIADRETQLKVLLMPDVFADTVPAMEVVSLSSPSPKHAR